MIYLQSMTQAELAELLYPLSRVKVRSEKELSPDEYAAAVEKKARAQARYRAKQIFHWVYQKFVTDWDSMSDLSKDLRVWLKENVAIFRLQEKVARQALDGTHKFLWQLGDGKTIESVIIPAALREKNAEEAFEADDEETDDDGAWVAGQSVEEAPQEVTPIREKTNPVELTPSQFAGSQTEARLAGGEWKRLTVCISSQVGCAMACKFCLTGVQGLDRHLQTHEIVTQVLELKRRAPITNVVFMGMGEPLHNLENVVKACEILIDQDGMGLSKRKVTVSTSGLVSGIAELGKRANVSLAISLNASNDEQRSQIMPVNKRWNIAQLLDACRQYPLGGHRRITFEYVLLKDFNDTLEDAARVYKLLKGIPAKVNLIPFNEHPGSEFKRPDDERVRAFQKYFLDRHMTATVRISRGRDILAACGQLRSVFGTARGTDRHKDYVTVQSQPSA
jgi:23S rRNA (adenine2503-C2)-methyltransferase